uniref:Rab-GAP TBC domain-containing protein n=1 Tax=Lygus hesperus TaxID=30085 RepID=A0A0K8SQQ5_LYGHE
METKSKSLYDMSSSGTEIFTHGGVGYVPPSATKDDVQTCGTLSIVSYSFGKCIEWKPNDVSIETDGSEQEWAMVNTSKSPSASSNSGGDTNPQRWLPVRIPILEIKSYRVSNKKTKLLLVHKDRLTHTAFYFQFENADCFTKSLRSVVKTRRSRHDKHTYDIVQERADPQMPHSFSDFNLLSDQKETVWKFVSDMRSRPYETTLSTFSKFSEYLHERPSEEVARLFEGRPQQPQPTVLDGSKSDGLGEYHIVERREKLPPRVLCPRGQPLSVHQWANAMDAEGRISEVKDIKKIIFEGGVQDSIRYEVWKFLLGYFPWNSSTHERQELRQVKTEEYFRMKLQWKSMTPEQEARFSDFRDRKTLIEKDVNRTDRTLPFFQGDDNPNLGLLYDVLMTYVMYDFDLGYVQGMSDLLSPILSVMSNEVDAFWCFVIHETCFQKL